MMRLPLLAMILAAAWFSVTSALGANPDFIRTIDGIDYLFNDYTYYSTSSIGANRDLRGWLYVPTHYHASQSYPLVMWLHGAGANPSNAINQNIDNLVINAQERGYLLYVPFQSGVPWGYDQLNVATAVIARATQQYNVDPSRVSVTGLSMGGWGVEQLLTTGYAEHFAAYAPLSMYRGAANTTEAASLVGKNLWIFHARDDTTSPIRSSRNTVSNVLLAQGITPPVYPAPWPTDGNFYYEQGNLRYSEHARGGHWSGYWDDVVYSNAALYDWMLSKNSSVQALDVGKSMSFSLITAPITNTNFTDSEGNVRVIPDRLNTVGADSTGRVWNNIGRDGCYRTVDVSVGFASDSSGDITAAFLSVSKAFGSIGSNVPDNITALTDPSVAAGYWCTLANQSAQIRLAGLVPNQSYDLEMFASVIASSGYQGLYSVNGQSVTLDAANNLSNLARLNGLLADSTGSLILDIEPTNGSTYAVLNTLTVTTSIPEPTTFSFMMAFGFLLGASMWRNGLFTAHCFS